MVRLIAIILSILALAGCENRYRYACQNPDNWDKDFCKKPRCEVSRECPEHIFKGQEAGLVTYSNNSNCSSCKGADK